MRDDRTLGRHVYGAAALALGIMGMVWGDLVEPWYPLPAVAIRTTIAYACAVAFVAGGAAVQARRSARVGFPILAVLYLFFAGMWSRRVLAYPQLIGTWLGCAEQLALAAAAVVGFAEDTRRGTMRTASTGSAARLVFGACVVLFGVAHFAAFAETARMVPGWLPGGQRFWAAATGAAHVAAGCAIVTGISARLAARLLAAMLLGFAALVWLPALARSMQAHASWGGTIVTLAMAGAAWMIAGSYAAAPEIAVSDDVRPAQRRS